MRDEQVPIKITVKTKAKIENLAAKYGYKQITVLEYLLSGKIDLKELK